MSPEISERVLHHTPEEVLAAIPHPEHPIISSKFSGRPDGQIVADGGPGLLDSCLLNGQIEDVLHAMAQVATVSEFERRKYGPDTFQVSPTITSSRDFVRIVTGYWDIPKILYVGPQEETTEGEPSEPKIRKVAVRLWGKEVEDFLDLLLPGTKFEIIPENGGDTVIVEL